MTDKTLADLIVEHGPYEPGRAGLWMDTKAGGLVADHGATEVNALRDELIELRAIKVLLPHWADSIDEDPDWSRGYVHASLREMRRRAGVPEVDA